MNKIYLGLLIFSILFSSSCDEEGTQLERDIAIIDNYLAENNIDAQQHSSGLRYKIIKKGSGLTPNPTDNIEISYTGKLLSDGTVFDATPAGETVTFPLNRLIEGWKIGIPLIEEGGEIDLYIPSSLGYGEHGSPGTIPPNANLIFNVKLVRVN